MARSRAKDIRKKAREGASEEAVQTTAESVERRGKSYLAIPDGYDTVTLKPDNEYYFDVVAYEPGEQDPRVASGKLNPETSLAGSLRFSYHRGFGPMEEDFICLQETFGVPCEGCKETMAMKKSGADFKKEIKPFLPKPREIYQGLVVENNADDMPEKPSIFEVSWHMFGKLLKPLAKGRAVPGKKKRKYLDYITPEKDGRTISFETREENTGDFTFTKIEGHKLLERDYEIPDEALDQALDLVELLAIDRDKNGKFDFDTYNKRMREALDGMGSATTEKEPEETTRPSRREKAEKQAEPECPVGGEIGTDFDTFEECDECDLRNDCEALSPEPIADEKAPEEVEEEPAEEPPFEEDEPEPAEEPKEEPKGTSDDETTCPAGGNIGIDFHELDDCDECPAWERCFELSKTGGEEEKAEPEPKKPTRRPKKAQEPSKKESKGEAGGEKKKSPVRRRRK